MDEDSAKRGPAPALTPEDDARQELIRSDSHTAVKTPSDQIEVKFITSDSINGDAKISIEQVKSAFAGMSKDELLKYVNDPFWVRMRMILFIGFWLIWVVMFAAAIAIIVVAPRCEAPTPKKWYQEGPIYEAKIDSFSPSGKLSDFTKMLNYLSEIKVKGLILSTPLSSDADGNVNDFHSIDPKFGSLIDLETFISAAKEKSIRILLSFVPNHSSIGHDWFNKSIAREVPFDSYYVWAPKAGSAPDGEPLPPNNWKSNTGGSAWSWNDVRQEFYLHQFDSNQPDLNFNNPKVQEEFTGILAYWLSRGVSGFNLDKVQYLLEDPELKEEERGIEPGFTHDEYGFYMHGKTYNRPELVGILREWRELVHNKTDGEGILMITGVPPIPSDANAMVVDLSLHTTLAEGLPRDSFATSLAKRVEAFIADNQTWSAVQVIGTGSTVADTLGKEAVDPLNMLSLLLPGTPMTVSGEELGLNLDEVAKFPWDPSLEINANENSHLEVYKLLSEIRADQAILYGNSTVKVLLNDTLVFARWKTGHPGYVLVYNTSPGNVTVDLSEFSQLPPELNIFAVGLDSSLKDSGRVEKKSISLSPHNAAVFTFVPSSES